jgi:hypothetical protein|tara:strand:+ start:174 stop:593 length:420 start_codon:yes stop_codon:yes gene_type:complete
MIDYSNKIFEVIDQVHHIVAKEMALPIYMDGHQGNHSVYIEPISDNLLEILTNGQNRQYTVLISYELTSGGNYTENTFKQVANVAEHIKRLFAPDNNANNNAVWSGGEVESVEYQRDEEDETKVRALITFSCIGYEVTN